MIELLNIIVCPNTCAGHSSTELTIETDTEGFDNSIEIESLVEEIPDAWPQTIESVHIDAGEVDNTNSGEMWPSDVVRALPVVIADYASQDQLVPEMTYWRGDIMYAKFKPVSNSFDIDAFR